MGFMAGFGEGFSRSFEQAQATRAQKEQDAFRLAYSDYVDKQKAYNEADSAWKQAMAKGELMAKKYGLPPEAGLQAAKYIQNGFSDEYVDKLLSQTTYSAPDLGGQPITGTPDAVNSNADTEQPAEASALDQTVASGLAQAPEAVTPASTMNSPIANTPIPDPNAPVPNGENVSISDAAGQSNMNVASSATPADGDILGGMFKPGGVFEHAGESDAEQAARTVRETAGISEDEFNKIQAGYQAPQIPDDPNFQINVGTKEGIQNVVSYFLKEDSLTAPNLAAAEAKATGAVHSTDKQERAAGEQFLAMLPALKAKIPSGDPEEDKIIQQAIAAIPQEPMQDIAKINSFITSAAIDGKELIDLAKSNNGAALSDTVGGGVSLFEGFKRDVPLGIDALLSIFGNPDATEDSVLAQIEGEIAKFESSGDPAKTAKIAEAYREFSSKLIRFTFSAGSSMGQTTSGQSNKEGERLLLSLKNSNDPVTFENNMKTFMNEKIRSSGSMLTEFLNNPKVDLAMTKAPKQMAKFAQPIKDRLKDDPNAAWIFEKRADAKPSVLTPSTNQSSGYYIPGTNTIMTPGYVDPDSGATYKGGVPTDPNNWIPKGKE